MVQNASVPPASAGRPKAQSIALGALYAALVALALWVIRDFMPAIAWACVVAIALWPALRRIDALPALRGRATLVAALLTSAVALLVVVPIAAGLVEAVDQSHELLGWLHRVEQTGIPEPDVLSHLPFGSQQASAWWQANLAKPLHPATAVKGVDGASVVTFGRHFGSRLAHAAVLFGFMLVTLFVIFQAGPRLSGSLLTGVRSATAARRCCSGWRPPCTER
ncbi:putative membrane protein [Burkholderia pseudomallei MSHR4300]|nr:putative membrane protein [Burkholderia pseudomallei MSHR4300]